MFPARPTHPWSRPPGNAAADMQEKVLSYLTGGSRVIWVVDPMNRVVTVYHSTREIRVLADDDVLDGGDLVPGFQLPLPELFG